MLRYCCCSAVLMFFVLFYGWIGLLRSSKNVHFETNSLWNCFNLSVFFLLLFSINFCISLNWLKKMYSLLQLNIFMKTVKLRCGSVAVWRISWISSRIGSNELRMTLYGWEREHDLNCLCAHMSNKDISDIYSDIFGMTPLHVNIHSDNKRIKLKRHWLKLYFQPFFVVFFLYFLNTGVAESFAQNCKNHGLLNIIANKSQIFNKKNQSLPKKERKLLFFLEQQQIHSAHFHEVHSEHISENEILIG